jgi:hypothetical protein
MTQKFLKATFTLSKATSTQLAQISESQLKAATALMAQTSFENFSWEIFYKSR